MKKLCLLCIICLSCGLISFAEDILQEKTEDFYKNLSAEGVKFYDRMRSCSPAKFSETQEAVYGKTKNNKCHYSYKIREKGETVEYHCIVPLQTSLAYATTSLDVRDFSESFPEVAQERLKQNAEIRKIIHDYCKKKSEII